MDWKNANDGPKWVPILNEVEKTQGIPPDLLARMAFQESSFRPDIIDGSHASPAGALGILQLEPAYFTSTHKSIPYDDDAVMQQISDAAEYIVHLYERFKDWGEALAAYNFGPGNEEKYLAGKANLPTETLNYVADITADVPGVLV